MQRIGGSLKALGAIGAAVGAVQLGQTLVNGIRAAVAAAAEQELAERKLAQALANTGQSVGAVLPGLRRFADEQQRLTGIADDQILSNQALLVSIGKLEGEGLRRATKAALDLSAGLGKDLGSAFEAVAKASAGNATALGKLGIKIDESVPKGQRFAAVLAQIEDRFGGQAAARMDTFTGQVERLKISFGELQETLGGPFLEVSRAVIETVLVPFTDGVTDAAKGSDTFRNAILDLAIALAETGVVAEPWIDRILGGIKREAENVGAVGGAVVDFVEEFGAAMGFVDRMGPGVFESIVGASTEAESKLAALVARLRELRAADPTDTDTPKPTKPPVFDVDTGPAKSKIDDLTDAWAEFQRGQMAAAEQAITLQEAYAGVAREVETSAASDRDLFAAIEERHIAALAAIDETIAASRRLKAETFDVGRAINQAIGTVGVQAAQDLGSAMVDAAFGADVSWGAFFRNFMRQIAEAIVQALILKLITSTFGGGFLNFGAGGTAAEIPVRAASGFMVPGNQNRGDAVPALLRPGELVLNRDQQRELLAGGRSGPMTVRIELGPNLRALADLVSVEVERGGARLVATEIVRPVRSRRA